MLSKTLTATACALALATVAHAQDAAPGAMNHGGMHSTAPVPGDNASTKAFKEADAAMMKNMDRPYTGNPDVDFRTHMIPHHEGAVAMAKVALAHAKDADTRAMAQKIIDDQEKEIAEMKAWLAKHAK
jgi:uncharacterized protein (DUF305 family)